ncbi:MAG: PIN domain-containing protein [Terriglobales bacterium]
MTARCLLDTNVLLRLLVPDDAAQAAAAERLMAACERGEVTAVVTDLVLAECIFVLESFYKRSRAAITAALLPLISHPGIETPRRAICIDALERFQRSRLHFVDCWLVATATADGLPLATFDRALARQPGVQAWEEKR